MLYLSAVAALFYQEISYVLKSVVDTIASFSSFPQTMLTTISMSAIATNGVVPGKCS